MKRQPEVGDYVCYNPSTGYFNAMTFRVIAIEPHCFRITYSWNAVHSTSGFTAAWAPFLALASFTGFVTVEAAKR